MALGGEVRRVAFEFVGDSRSLSQESGKASKSLDGVSSSGTKASGVMSKLKPAAAAAGVAAGAMAAKWALAGIDMAQTADLLDSSFSKTFGDESEDLLARNEELRQSLGLTEAEFQKQVTAIGAVNIGLHQTQAEAAAFSEDVLKVAGDVAAFNGDLAESPHVIEAINSALIGNTETLEKYGIEVTAADIKQRALADSGKATEAELTQLEKRTATMALITERAALMQGSLNEAQEDGATSSNELSAKMGDLQTEVGAALLPLKIAFLEILLAAVPILEALTPLIALLGQLISGLMPILTPFIKALEVVAQVLEAVVKAITDVIHWLGQAGNKVIQFGNTVRRFLPMNLLNAAAGIVGRFHAGGVVPGPSGSEQLAVVQAGEEIRTRGQATTGGGGGGGGMMMVNVTVNVAPGGDPIETARQIKDLLEQLERRGG